LRSVAEGKNEAHKKQTDVKVVKDDIEYVDALKFEYGVLHCITQNDESNVIVALARKISVQNKLAETIENAYESEPGENQIKALIKHFHVNPEFACK